MTTSARAGTDIRTILINLDSRTQLVIVGVIVGIASGFAALLLNHSLKILSGAAQRIPWPWAAALLPSAGIFLTVIWLKYIIRDFSGHGVPEVIYAVGMKGGRLKLRSSVSKLVGSLITLSSGGSAGPEAPVVMSGASIGSNIATWFKSNDRVRIAAAGAGAAAAIASIFNAPIVGIIFTMEVILGEWTALNLLPVAIASATGTVVSRIFNGNQIPFQHRTFTIGLDDTLASIGLAVLTAVCAAGLIRGLKEAESVLRRFFRNNLVRAGAGGLIVGSLILFFPHVRGEGYETVRGLIEGRFEEGFLFLLLLVTIKIVATSVTIGAGGAGGVFAPSLVIGSLCGFFYFELLARAFPGHSLAGAGLYALVGMAGVLAGTLQAPLTGTFLILEITRGYDAILPLLIVSFLSATLVKRVEKHSIYHKELITKGMFIRPRTDARILSDLSIVELLESDIQTVNPETSLEDMIPVIRKSRRDYFAVVDRAEGTFLGMVTLNDIKSYLFDADIRRTIIVEEVMRSDMVSVSLSDSLIDILKKFDESGSWSLPVVEEGRFKGLISKATLLDHYRTELISQTEF